MNNFSYWQQSLNTQTCDLCIIGGGIVGWNAAISLAQRLPAKRIIVIEKDLHGGGASFRNAGFACFGSMTELLEDVRRVGEDETFALVERRWKGLRDLRQLLGDDGLEYDHVGGFELFRKTDRAIFEEVESLIPTYNHALKSIIQGAPIFSISHKHLENWKLPGIRQIIHNGAEGQLHPGKMMQQLQALGRQLGIEYWPGHELTRFEEDDHGVHLILATGDRLNCRSLLFCTNGFTHKLIPQLQVKPARNLVLVSTKVPKLHWNGTIHIHQGYVYARRIGKRVLIGGGRHISPTEEETDEVGINQQIKAYLLEWLHGCLITNDPFDIEYEWSGVLGVGAQKMPIVRKISDRIGVAVRLGGMGVAIGRNVGVEAADLMYDSVS